MLSKSLGPGYGLVDGRSDAATPLYCHSEPDRVIGRMD